MAQQDYRTRLNAYREVFPTCKRYGKDQKLVEIRVNVKHGNIDGKPQVPRQSLYTTDSLNIYDGINVTIGSTVALQSQSKRRGMSALLPSNSEHKRYRHGNGNGLAACPYTYSSTSCR